MIFLWFCRAQLHVSQSTTANATRHTVLASVSICVFQHTVALRCCVIISSCEHDFEFQLSQNSLLYRRVFSGSSEPNFMYRRTLQPPLHPTQCSPLCQFAQFNRTVTLSCCVIISSCGHDFEFQLSQNSLPYRRVFSGSGEPYFD